MTQPCRENHPGICSSNHRSVAGDTAAGDRRIGSTLESGRARLAAKVFKNPRASFGPTYSSHASTTSFSASSDIRTPPTLTRLPDGEMGRRQSAGCKPLIPEAVTHPVELPYGVSVGVRQEAAILSYVKSFTVGSRAADDRVERNSRLSRSAGKPEAQHRNRQQEGAR